MKDFNYLNTDDNALDEIPLSDYPRPQLKRNSYICLNGEWDFCISKQERITQYDSKIIVPFPPESILSKVHKTKNKKEYLFYKKIFTIPTNFLKEKLILHFGAVDQVCWIYFNGKEIGYHEGGYLPFEFEIQEYLSEINVLEVKIKDDLNTSFPYGKQKSKRGGMWYTPISGIWQTVWLESVNENYIKHLKIDSKIDTISIKIFGDVQKKTITIYTPYGERKEDFFDNIFSLKIDNPRFWSPEDPYLYYFKIKTSSDEIFSYFALRDLTIEEDNGKKYFFLNGNKYFFHGILDQGYFSDGIFTPKSMDYYKKDILTMKSLGFNTLRKHIKIEPLNYYYLCDKYGMIVFQDMVNNSKYSFFHDTILPTIGLKKMKDKKIDSKNKDIFLKHSEETINHLYNSPSICLWTIFNEGWGQFDTKEVTNSLKSIDSTRFIDSASGWFNNFNSIDSKHIYFKKIKIKYQGKPLLISEFGGYSLKIKDHYFNPNKTYGYKKFNNQEKYEDAIFYLYKNEIAPLLKNGLCGCIYTQLSDIEDEVNGLLTFDRKILKVHKENFLKIKDLLSYKNK